MADKKQLEELINNATSEEVKNLAKAELNKLELVENAAKGDDLSKALVVLKDVVDKFKASPQGQGGAKVSKEQVEEMVRSMVQNTKIRFEDLDPELKAKLSGSVQVQLSLTTTFGKGSGGPITEQQLNRPLFQKLLSDLKAYNNVYLYGGAGTGKTFIAEQMAKFLGWKYVEINCNQFTSPLELVGGQTIKGYQKGKLEMAWTNIMENDTKVAGAVLCLDELPKLDPNTAGVLNAALAKTKQKGQGKTPIIYNGRGQEIKLENMFVIGTGNTQLNDTSPEYEANFKQDLSLQDRFAGSTYEVIADYQSEYEVFMKGVTFIWLYLIKLREKILDRKLTGVAFVSIRIMMSLKDTYLVYRTPELQKINSDYAIKTPKTLKDGLDEFLNLFTKAQQDELKDSTNYNGFLKIAQEKDALPVDELDTRAELKEAQKIIQANTEQQNIVNA
tara:strand:- start:4624 stop:5958 length:1335 start_codon:yes stop_codon:yes gene_type:complete